MSTAGYAWLWLVRGDFDLETLLDSKKLVTRTVTFRVAFNKDDQHEEDAYKRFFPDTLLQCMSQITIDAQAVKDGIPGYSPTHYP